MTDRDNGPDQYQELLSSAVNELQDAFTELKDKPESRNQDGYERLFESVWNVADLNSQGNRSNQISNRLEEIGKLDPVRAALVDYLQTNFSADEYGNVILGVQVARVFRYDKNRDFKGRIDSLGRDIQLKQVQKAQEDIRKRAEEARRQAREDAERLAEELRENLRKQAEEAQRARDERRRQQEEAKNEGQANSEDKKTWNEAGKHFESKWFDIESRRLRSLDTEEDRIEAALDLIHDFILSQDDFIVSVLALRSGLETLAGKIWQPLNEKEVYDYLRGKQSDSQFALKLLIPRNMRGANSLLLRVYLNDEQKEIARRIYRNVMGAVKDSEQIVNGYSNSKYDGVMAGFSVAFTNANGLLRK